MGAIESNQWYANVLGWTSAELGSTAIDAGLVAAIQDAQARLEVGVDGICGPASSLARRLIRPALSDLTP
jgi:hypothetical protein